MKLLLLVTFTSLCQIAGSVYGNEVQIKFSEAATKAFGDKIPLSPKVTRKDGKIELRLENVSSKHVVITKQSHQGDGTYEAKDGTKLGESGFITLAGPELLDHVVLQPHSEKGDRLALSSGEVWKIEAIYKDASIYTFHSVLSGYFPTVGEYLTFTVSGRLQLNSGNGEQDGADQPATSPESKPEGQDKSQPEKEADIFLRAHEVSDWFGPDIPSLHVQRGDNGKECVDKILKAVNCINGRRVAIDVRITDAELSKRTVQGELNVKNVPSAVALQYVAAQLRLHLKREGVVWVLKDWTDEPDDMQVHSFGPGTNIELQKLGLSVGEKGKVSTIHRPAWPSDPASKMSLVDGVLLLSAWERDIQCLGALLTLQRNGYLIPKINSNNARIPMGISFPISPQPQSEARPRGRF